jgi:cobalt transporter subunit CbtB
MSDITATQELEAPSVPLISLADLLPYAVFFAIVATVALYFVSANESSAVHEWVHDARHLLGFPCH